MESRNLEKELQYFRYYDPGHGEDVENIYYPALITFLQELLERVEELEQKLDKEQEYQYEQNQQ